MPPVLALRLSHLVRHPQLFRGLQRTCLRASDSSFHIREDLLCQQSATRVRLHLWKEAAISRSKISGATSLLLLAESRSCLLPILPPGRMLATRTD